MVAPDVGIFGGFVHSAATAPRSSGDNRPSSELVDSELVRDKARIIVRHGKAANIGILAPSFDSSDLVVPGKWRSSESDRLNVGDTTDFGVERFSQASVNTSEQLAEEVSPIERGVDSSFVPSHVILSRLAAKVGYAIRADGGVEGNDHKVACLLEEPEQSFVSHLSGFVLLSVALTKAEGEACTVATSNILCLCLDHPKFCKKLDTSLILGEQNPNSLNPLKARRPSNLTLTNSITRTEDP